MHWNDQLWKCIDSAAEALSGLERSSKGIASMRIATERQRFAQNGSAEAMLRLSAEMRSYGIA